MAVAGERDHDALDIELADDSRKVLRLSEQHEVLESGNAVFGNESTKLTRLIPFSGCWRTLRPTNWPTSPAPTMIVF
jgi:hypothetical protein